MDTPLYTQPAVGWRIYGCYLLDDGSVLTSWTKQWHYWSLIGEELEKMKYVGDEATCMYHSHPAPDPDHTCGFYAYHTLDDLAYGKRPWQGLDPLRKVLNQRPAVLQEDRVWRVVPTPPVLALVQGYGERFVAHDTTYRSQHMRIAALCADGKHTSEIVRAHAQQLDIPALSLEEMKEYAEYAGVCLA